jgi:hypothetical protein
MTDEYPTAPQGVTSLRQASTDAKPLTVQPTAAPGPAPGLAIAGFVTALVGFVFALFPLLNIIAPVPGIVGLVLSAVGRSQAKARGGGSGLATAGVVLGIVVIMLTIISLIACGSALV